MFEEIRKHQELQKANILRSFGVNPESDESLEFAKGEIEYDELQKAVYADTAENRKLGRVGQEYHRGKGKKEGEQPTKSTSSISGKEIKSLKNRRNELVAEYSELRKKNLNGTLKDEERSRFRALGKEIDDIDLKLTRKNPTSKREIEKRLFALKQKGVMNLTDEERKEYGELSGRLLDKKFANNKSSEDYPSRQEEKEIERMMQDDGLDPDEQSEKTWRKYYKKVKQQG